MVDVVRPGAESDLDRSVFESSPLANSSLLRSPRSPDQASPIYPERAIRPLPRSRLKSRLSPEQATHIQYPPANPPAAVVVEGYGSGSQEDGIAGGVRSQTGVGGAGSRAANGGYVNHVHSHELEDPRYHQHHLVHQHQESGHCTCGHSGEEGGLDSGDEDVEFDHPDYRYSPALGAAGTPTPMTHQPNGQAIGKPPLHSLQRRLHDSARAAGKVPPSASASAGGSGDGYESFENTSNKKKRKIPLSHASSMLHQSSLSAEMANMGISGQNDGAADDGGGAVQAQHLGGNGVGVQAGGTGISGAGRGRYGRSSSTQKNGVRRAGAAVSPGNGYAPMKVVPLPVRNGEGLQQHQASTTAVTAATPGIISQAIKTAAQQGPLPPLTPRQAAGKENTPLYQVASRGTPPTHPGTASVTPKTQFTFQYPSESAGKMVDQAVYSQGVVGGGYAQSQQCMPGSYPGQYVYGNQPLPPQQQQSRGLVNGHGQQQRAQGTQTMPPVRAGGQQRNNGAGRAPPPPVGGNNPPPPHPNKSAAPPPAPAPPPKPRRRPSKEYALAARQRQLQQEYQNYHQRPSKDNMYICMFCEYEDIFGVPPLALIRSYEIRDRKERKKKEEQRRLLEKARAKGKRGRKGGKGGKAGANGLANPNNTPQAAVTNGALPGNNTGYDANGLPLPEHEEEDGEEFYDEEEEDEEGYDDEAEFEGEYADGPDARYVGAQTMPAAVAGRA
ncbi:hypothetical protein LTR62_003872 [Meristemomyces frigidus]|uniref:Uncharacterized protein n=1 Tax=Meristemomyces frigidus TaxID=1508187 RepID=A0AAN7TGT5_9PEZI|nr:hypothetical protein LTR62_003872 [Meristemomyces frigidus]